MKKYRAVFLAGDAVLYSKDFYTSDADFFDETSIILELMDLREDFQEKYGCAVSVRVTSIPVEEKITPAPKWWYRIFGAMRRVSSFFGL